MKKNLQRIGFIATLAIFCLSNVANAQWEAASTGLTNNNVVALAYNGTALFAGTEGGLFISTNNGSLWTACSDANVSSANVKALVTIGTNIFAGCYGGKGVFLSTDNGATWTAVNTGFSFKYVDALAVSGNKIYASLMYEGVFWSNDNGTTWTKITAAPLADNTVRSIVSIGSAIFAGTDDDNGVFKSTDDGATWTAVNTGLTQKIVESLAVVGTKLYAATKNGVFVTSDNGGSWATVDAETVDNATYLAVVGSTLIVGTPYGIYSLKDGETSFTDVSDGVGAANLFISSNFAMDATYLFAGNTLKTNGVVRRLLSQLGNSTGITELNNISINLYPNPTTKNITIEWTGNKTATLQVMNVLGEIVIEQRIAKTTNIDLSNKGIYFVKVFDGTKIHTQKIVVQ